MKFLEPTRKPKVSYTDNSLKFGKSCEELSWNQLCVYTTQIRNKCDCWKSSAQSERKAPLLYCCNRVWMRNGGQIPWNAMPICETFKISRLMGRHHTKDVLENLLKDQSFRLVHWSNITLPLRRTYRDCISLVQKSWQVFPRLSIVCGKNLERRHYDRRHWRIGGDGRIGTPHQKAQCKGRVNADERWQF